jgi:hypothetical protein
MSTTTHSSHLLGDLKTLVQHYLNVFPSQTAHKKSVLVDTVYAFVVEHRTQTGGKHREEDSMMRLRRFWG